MNPRRCFSSSPPPMATKMKVRAKVKHKRTDPIFNLFLLTQVQLSLIVLLISVGFTNGFLGKKKHTIIVPCSQTSKFHRHIHGKRSRSRAQMQLSLSTLLGGSMCHNWLQKKVPIRIQSKLLHPHPHHRAHESQGH